MSVGRVSEPWASAAARWAEAAGLLASAGRGPTDARVWLGAGWSGAAARAFDDWAEAFEQATRRASGVLADASEVARAAAVAPGAAGAAAAGAAAGAAGLTGVHDAARVVAAVPIPGQGRDPSNGHLGHPAEREPKRPEQTPKEQAPKELVPQEHSPKEEPERAAVPVGPLAGTAGGTVPGWIEQARRVLLQHGYRADQLDPKSIALIIKYESAGDPGAVNDWDANAARGTPSMGLMQTIKPTFERWQLPGHGKILDPVDNIIAGVRYAVHRYGSVSRVPGVLSVAAGGGYRGY